MAYYNTNHETGEKLKAAWGITNAQEVEVLTVFYRQMDPHYSLTPFEVLHHSGLNVPVTSIRRAMTDLSARGILEKTAQMRAGDYGKMCHTWRLKQA